MEKVPNLQLSVLGSIVKRGPSPVILDDLWTNWQQLLQDAIVSSAGSKVQSSRSISVPAGEADISASNLFKVVSFLYLKKGSEAMNEYFYNRIFHPPATPAPPDGPCGLLRADRSCRRGPPGGRQPRTGSQGSQQHSGAPPDRPGRAGWHRWPSGGSHTCAPTQKKSGTFR